MSRLSKLVIIFSAIGIIALTAAIYSTLNDDEADWINPPPEGMTKFRSLPVIEEKDIFEVVSSKKDAAVEDLAESPFLRLSVNNAKKFTGSYYTCPTGKHPYLVRAPFGQGGTGSYSVIRADGRLIVSHGSLGSSWAVNKSALVINLDFEPKGLYTHVSIAQ